MYAFIKTSKNWSFSVESCFLLLKFSVECDFGKVYLETLRNMFTYAACFIFLNFRSARVNLCSNFVILVQHHTWLKMKSLPIWLAVSTELQK